MPRLLGAAAIALVLLALAAAAPALAATIRVPADQPTLQAGLDAAAPGDTVLAAPGVYLGPANRNLDFAGKSVVLRSSAGAATTIIDPQNATFGFNFHSGETAAAVVDGFTIRHATDGTYYGGAVFSTGASPTFKRCTFTQNQANQGAGIYCEWSSMALIDCDFSGNSAANWGGGVYFLNSSPTLTNCSFSGNAAAIGAGLYFSGGAGTVTGCTFTGNAAANAGGGIFCRNSASPTITGCTFGGNSANHGGGIACNNASPFLDRSGFTTNTAINMGGAVYAEYGPTLQATGCMFSGNRTTAPSETWPGGGAIYSFIAALALSGCSFSGNSAHGQYALGGAIHCGAGGVTTSSLSGCTFTGNSSDWQGGALLMRGYSTMEDCAFTDNSAREGGAIYAYTGPIMTRSTFVRNAAVQWGGGIRVSSGLNATQCTWFDNSASEGGGIFISDQYGLYTLSGCTLVRNSAALGAGVLVSYYDNQLTVENTIIAQSPSGEGLACSGSLNTPVLSCTDISGNAGGDWVGCIADQLGINGCFAADPRFCDPRAGDLTLAEDSPCAPAHSPGGCGLIGAWPVGCVVPIGVAETGAPPASVKLRVVPNPVRGDAVVEWTSLATGPAVLEIYDPGGRLLRRRDLGARGAGPQEARWADVIGATALPSGVYFLQAGGREGTRVLVIR